LPVEVLVENRLVVCLGACAEVAYKIDRLLAAGAIVRVVAAGEPHPIVAEHARAGAIALETRAPAPADAEGAAVVFVSPEHAAIGAGLAAEARASGRLVCTLDRPAASTFVNPAVARGAHLVFALSSGGRSPALLRRLREDLERALADPRLAAFVDRIAALRRDAPPGERAARGRAAVAGFAAALTFRLPAWFERGAAGPDEPIAGAGADGPDGAPPRGAA
jgi:siroheme synthase-like protein